MTTSDSPTWFSGCPQHEAFDYHCHHCLIRTVGNLSNALEMYVAHTENLIERVLVLEEGADWQYMAKCHDCTQSAMFDDQDGANGWCQEHADLPMLTGSRLYHAPYVTPIVKR